MDTNPESHAFSVELKHKKHLKTVAIPINGRESVVVEGFLGKLTNVGFVEDSLLEIHGENGVFRIDMKPEEAPQMASVKKEVK
jgi:hypothetical protein